MAESSVGTISLDLVIQNNTAEQLEKIQNQVERPAKQLGESIEASIEAPMQKTAENVQKTLGSAVENAEKAAQKVHEQNEKLAQLAQKAWERYTQPPTVTQQEIKPRTAAPIDYEAIRKEQAENQRQVDEFTNSCGGKLSEQVQGIIKNLKDFKIPTTSIERLEAELENTRAKSQLLKAEWKDLATANPTEKTAAKMLRLQQQIIATDKATERLESELNKTAASETLSTVDAQFQGIFDRMKNFQIPTTPVERLEAELENTRTKIALLQKQWQELSAAEPSEKVVSQMLRLQQQIVSTQKTSQRLESQLEELNQTDLNHLQQECNETVSDIQNIGEACNSANERIKNCLERPLNIVGNAGRTSFSAIKKAGSKAFDVLKSVGGKALDSLKSRFGFLNKSAGLLLKPVKKLGTTLKNTFRRVFVMATLYAAVKAIKKSFSDILKSNDELSNSLNEVKANLSIAFTPVIQAVMPALNTMMSGLARATKYIAGFMAGLFGMTYKQAAEATKKLHDTGKQAADTAKKASMSMAGIDEMNILSDNSDDSENEEDTGIDYSKLDISEPVLPDWAERLKQAIRSGDWYGVGEILAERINAVFGGIDWDNAEKKVTDGVNRICDFVNGFVDNINWEYLGNTLSGGINTITSAVNAFSDNIHWEEIGSGLANGLTQAVNKIKWKQLGRSMSANIRILTNLLYNFVTEFDWKNLGKGIGEAVNGWFDGIDFGKLSTTLSEGIKGIFSTITATLQTVDLSSIGSKIAGFVNNIDIVGILSEFASSVSGFVTGLLDFLINFIEQTDWLSLGEQIFDGIAGMLQNIDWTGLIERIAKLLGSVVGGASALISSILMKAWEALKQAWNSVKNYFNEKIEECGGNIWQGVGKGILDALKNVGNWIKEHIFKPFMDGFKKAFGIHSPSKEMATMGGFIIDGLFNAVSKGIAKIREIFGKMLNTIKNIFSGIGNWFGNKFSEAWDNIKSIFANPAEFFSKVWDGIKGCFSHVSGWFKDTFSEAWEKVKNVFSSGGEIFGGITDGIFETFRNIVNSLIDGINWVIEQPFNAINWALDGIRGVQIMDWYPFEWLPYIDVPQIPKLANGGLATAPTLAMVGDNKNAKTDPEVIAPLSKLEGMLGDNSEITEMLKIIIELLKSGINIEIINYMFRNSREFSREVIKAVAEDNARKGEK